MTQPPQDPQKFPPPEPGSANPAPQPTPDAFQTGPGAYRPAQPTSGYGSPGYPTQTPYPPPPRKPRPRGLWFLGPALLLLIAVGVAAAAGIALFQRFNDASTFSSGTAHTMTIEESGNYTIWLEENSGRLTSEQCSVTGPEGPITTQPMSFELKAESGRSMVGARTFDAPAGEVTVECPNGAAPYQVAVSKSVRGGDIAGLAAGILVPLFLGAIGVLWLIVLTILFFTRPKRV